MKIRSKYHRGAAGALLCFVLAAMVWAMADGARAQGVVEHAFRAAEALARGEAQGLSVADGKVVPMEGAGDAIDLDDSDLQVLLPFEKRREINVIYSKFEPITPNVANPLDEAILADPERIASVGGRRGQAFSFSGGRISATLPRLSVREVLDRGCTLFAWVKPETVAGDRTLTVCSVNRLWHLFELAMREAKLEATLRVGKQRVTVAGVSALKAGEWQLVAAVLDPFSKEMRLYLDGRREGEAPLTPPEERANSCVQFLAAGYPLTDRDSFLGAMDDAGMLTRPLGDAQVADLFAGRARRGSFVSAPLPLQGEFNTVRLEVKESQPGTSQLFIRQNEAWHRVRMGEDLICDMPARMPLTGLQYKVVLAGATAFESVGFELENRAYTPDKNKFSFLFLGDMHLGPMPALIRWAYETYPDIKLITCPGDIASVLVFDASYRAAWLDNPRAWPGLFPWFMAPGNHDIEYPRFVNYMVKRQGPAVPLSLPGMRNFREGPFDTYPEHGGYEDRFMQYSFDYLNTHFVIVNIYYHDKLLPDSSDGKVTYNRMAGHLGKPKRYVCMGSVNEDMLAWLDADLGATQADFKFLVYHEGAYPVPGGRHKGDSLDSPHYPGNSGPDGSRPMRDRFWSLLSKHNVTATFVGHSHSTARTWAADPLGEGPPVYEIEGGGVMVVKNPMVVTIDDKIATVRQYTTSANAMDLREPFPPIVFDKSANPRQYPPLIELHDGAYERGYPMHDMRHFRFEVGDDLESATMLYFEARDNNLRDRVTFSFPGLPEFFEVYDESRTFRRARLGGRVLKDGDVGTYAFEAVASDGKHEDRVKLNVEIVPGAKPEVIGWNIADGSTHKRLKRVLFFCRDNVKLVLGRSEQFFSVQKDGKPETGWSRYAQAASDDLAWIGVRKGGACFEPGEYEITAFCQDGCGVQSDPAVLRFKVVEDGADPALVEPWVEGIHPFDGATVASLERISVWVNAISGTDVARRSLVELTRAGKPVACRTLRPRDPGGTPWGDLDLLPEESLPEGEYKLRVTPVVVLHGKESAGVPVTAIFRVEKR